MSFKENTSDSECKQAKMKVIKVSKQDEEHHQQNHQQNTSLQGSGKIKYSQKFCNKWLHVFEPWLTRHPEDLNKPFCRACQCVLDCNKCHLQRHERTTKHKRNLVILQNNGEVAARQNLTIRQERSKYYLQKKKAMLENVNSNSPTKRQDSYDNEALNDGDDDCRNPSVKDNFQHMRLCEVKSEEKELRTDFQSESLKNEVISNDEIIQQNQFKVSNVFSKERTQITRSSQVPKVNAYVKKEGLKLLMQIHKDKNDLMDSFKEFIAAGEQVKQQQNHTQPKEKNHVDLFFESVSSSVKLLSPKLIAEAKMRVSQLICELELRELTETNNNSGSGSGSVNGSSNSGALNTVLVSAVPNSNPNNNNNNNATFIINHTPHPQQQHFETLS